MANAQTPATMTVVEVGQFHGDDVKSLELKNGDWWLGLFPEGQGYAWSRVPISVATSRDEMVDEDAGPYTGLTVSVPSRVEPLLLVRGMDEVAKLHVVTAAVNVALDGKSDVPLMLSGKTYQLKVTNPRSNDGTIASGASVSLFLDNIQQELYSVAGAANEPNWELIWAGDMDGDGKLDLYVDMSDHYNVSEKRVFLSSRAESGKLVKQVAVLRTTGC